MTKLEKKIIQNIYIAVSNRCVSNNPMDFKSITQERVQLRDISVIVESVCFWILEFHNTKEGIDYKKYIIKKLEGLNQELVEEIDDIKKKNMEMINESKAEKYIIKNVSITDKKVMD